MEEALVLCALDISGRPYLGFDAKFQSEKIGEMDTQMIEEFLEQFAYMLALIYI